MDKVKKFGKIAIVIIAFLVLIAIAIVALVLYAWIGILGPYYNVPNDNKAVMDYDQSMGLVSQDTYDALIYSDKAEKLELGVNEAGQVVFKHPYKAFGRAKKEYKNVWKYADKELGLKHLSRTYYMAYTDDEIIAQIVASDETLKSNAEIYKEILQIYANSYNKHR